MTDLVIFKLGAAPGDPVAWGAFGEGAMIEAGRVADVAALGALRERFPDDARLVGVLRGEQVAMRRLNSPPRQQAKLLAAASLLLEDELAAPIEDVHFIVSTSEPRAALAIARDVIDEWMEAFDLAGVALNELTVDYLAIGAAPATIVLVEDGEGDGARLIAGCGDYGFAAERAIAERAIPPMLAEADEAATIIAYQMTDFGGVIAGRPADRRRLTHDADVVAIFGAALSARPAAANLLQGAYKRKKGQAFNVAAWRRPALLAASLAGLAVFSGIAAGVRDMRTANAYESAAAAMHQAAFPTFTGDDLRAHARQLLAGGASATSFLDMSARLAASLEGHDGVAIDRIRYNGARGQFMFTIRSTSDAGIETFRTALAANGLVATDNGGYRRAGEAWVGEMTARVR